MLSGEAKTPSNARRCPALRIERVGTGSLRHRLDLIRQPRRRDRATRSASTPPRCPSRAGHGRARPPMGRAAIRPAQRAGVASCSRCAAGRATAARPSRRRRTACPSSAGAGTGAADWASRSMASSSTMRARRLPRMPLPGGPTSEARSSDSLVSSKLKSPASSLASRHDAIERAPEHLGIGLDRLGSDAANADELRAPLARREQALGRRPDRPGAPPRRPRTCGAPSASDVLHRPTHPAGTASSAAAAARPVAAWPRGRPSRRL